jgi:lipid-binding SYLF domain-containing protein
MCTLNIAVRYSKRGLAIALCWIPALLLVDTRTTSITRIANATRVLETIIGAPAMPLQEDLLQNARCVGTFSWAAPREFAWGTDYGKGIVVCRNRQGWSAPSLVKVTGGDPALQILNGDTDVLIVAVNANGESVLMQDRVVIPPRQRNADIVFYARTRGTCSGFDAAGITITPDTSANRSLYGRWVNHRDILSGTVPSPASAEGLYAEVLSNQ